LEYKTAEEARSMEGLRLVLTAGVPAPWSEAAKAMFKVKGIPFVPVLQQAGGENAELVAWTGHRNAPTAMYNSEPPCVTWLDILNLAERLQPEPSLLPADLDQRILMYGLLNELAGEGGMLWNGRYLMFRAMEQAYGAEAVAANPMFRDYRYSTEKAAMASGRMIEILTRLERQLAEQEKQGSRYFIGGGLSALDLYWACFSQTLEPLPEEICPMPGSIRRAWQGVVPVLAADGYVPAASLLQHRDFIFRDHIGLPLDF
jgi:glutathione S-transferase